MARKPMSDEQRKAAGERLAAARAAKVKKNHIREQEAEAEIHESQNDQPKTVEVSEELLTKLLAKVEELEAKVPASQSPQDRLSQTAKMQGITLGGNGIQGIQYKYPVDKGYYPDPTERLYDEPALKRHALRENFIFKWDVEGVTYENHNITYSEPRFVIELFRRMFDEEGNDTGKMYFVKRAYMHEDELVYRMAADKLGILNSFETFEDMMNEMRFQRFRSWLLEVFNPPKIKARSGVNTIVVDGKPVDIHDNEEFVDAARGIDQAAAIQREVSL